MDDHINNLKEENLKEIKYTSLKNILILYISNFEYFGENPQIALLEKLKTVVNKN